MGSSIRRNIIGMVVGVGVAGLVGRAVAVVAIEGADGRGLRVGGYEKGYGMRGRTGRLVS